MEIDSNDKLLVALDYVFTPIVPVILMLMEDKKNRPFIKAHNAQALALGIVLLVVNILLSWTCIVPILTLVLVLYYGYKGYQGETFSIPVITDFVKNQGWA